PQRLLFDCVLPEEPAAHAYSLRHSLCSHCGKPDRFLAFVICRAEQRRCRNAKRGESLFGTLFSQKKMFERLVRLALVESLKVAAAGNGERESEKRVGVLAWGKEAAFRNDDLR